MRLNAEKAQNLIDKIKNVDIENTLNEQNNTWETRFNEFPKALGIAKNDGKSLDDFLKETRFLEMNRESILLKNVGDIGNVRFFPPKDQNIVFDPQSVFVRGIDTARAVLEIAKYGESKYPYLEEDIKSALMVFQEKIALCGDDLKKEKECLKEFNGAMHDLTIKTGIIDAKHAEKSIHFVRDFIWKKTWQEESFCTQVLGEDGYSIRLAKPIEVNSNESDNEIKLNHIKSQRYGNWFTQFINQNEKDLLRLPTTPMSRISYNPGNAYDSSNIYVDKEGQIKQILNGTHVAITEPYQNHNPHKKLEGTKIIHKSLIIGGELDEKNNKLPHRLESIVNNQFDQWKGIFDKQSVVEVPILHQTLIGDGVFPGPLSFLIPDQKKSSSMLDNKEKSNEYVRQMLGSYKFYRNRETGEILKLSKSEELTGRDQYTEIKFKLLETNHCINQHHKYSKVRNQTVDDSRALIEIARARLEAVSQLKDLPEDIQTALNKVTNFLKESDYGMTPYKSHEKVSKDLDTITNYFKDKKNCETHGISLSTGNNIALSAQTATNLKCMNQESYFKAAHRIINNSPIAKTPFLSAIIRGVSWFVLQAIKTLTVWPMVKEVSEWVKHNTTRRREVDIATNETLLTESLGGEKFGGCMSSADRAEEIEQQVQGNLRYFHEKGTISYFDDSVKDKEEFIKNYLDTQEKHIFNKMSTGVPATSDNETRAIIGTSGLASDKTTETKEEQKISQVGVGMRKGQTDKTVSSSEYVLNRKQDTYSKMMENFKAANPEEYKQHEVKTTKIEASIKNNKDLPLFDIIHKMNSSNNESRQVKEEENHPVAMGLSR